MVPRRRRRPFLALLYVFLLTLVTTCLALPSHDHAFLPFPPSSSPPSPAQENALTPRRPPFSNPLPPTQDRAIAHTHNPRALRGYKNLLNLGAGWNLYYTSWHAIALPVQLASFDLVRFYSTIIANAAGVWRVAPPRQHLQIALSTWFILRLMPYADWGDPIVGNIQLFLDCAEQPIPWEMVELFGKKMLQLTEAGWTGVYRIMLSHAETGVTINVVAKVLEDMYWEDGERKRGLGGHV